RQGDRQLGVAEEPVQILERERDALQEMRLAFVEASETVSAESLHDAHVDVSVVVAHEDGALEFDEIAEAIDVEVEELLAQFGREIGLGVVEERGDVVLQRAFSAALVIEEEGIRVAQHDVARLKIAIEEEVVVGAEQELGEATEVVFEGLLVERNP